HKNLTILELLESSQITKCDGFCRNHCVLLKISKELSCKFFKVLGQVLNKDSNKHKFFAKDLSFTI
ncbi:hypothetical protein, partial [Leptospira sp. Pond_2020]|uniref:hypothetical protein n=1 Tax=Leptospira sp. Pond_2020 TaxID=2846916 RepID=UPI001E626200